VRPHDGSVAAKLQPAKVELGVVCCVIVMRPVAPNVVTPPEEHVGSSRSERRLELESDPFHVAVACDIITGWGRTAMGREHS
jgi:hypothetical protein